VGSKLDWSKRAGTGYNHRVNDDHEDFLLQPIVDVGPSGVIWLCLLPGAGLVAAGVARAGQPVAVTELSSATALSLAHSLLDACGVRAG
jgi:hypothetical protein